MRPHLLCFALFTVSINAGHLPPELLKATKENLQRRKAERAQKIPLPSDMRRRLAESDNDKPVLRFREDGTFKILQVADQHITVGQYARCDDLSVEQEMYPCSDLNTTAFVNRMIDLEDPDLIVFTGDNIFGNHAGHPFDALEMSFSAAIEREIPWAAVFGNHDDMCALSRTSMMEWISAQPYSLASAGPDFGELCVGNYRLDVLASEGNSSALTLYFLDSRAYSEEDDIDGYDWIHQDQIDWFNDQVAQVANASYPNPPPSALGFWHIPIPEYNNASSVLNETVGYHGEAISSPQFNSGFGDALVASGTVRAVTVGHDHNNNFCAPYEGVALCYGGGTGYGTYGEIGLSRMDRVFKVSENGTMTSHKRLDDTEATIYNSQSLYPFEVPTEE